MGHPKRQRKKYTTPLHPWEKDRMDAEDKLCSRYGLRSKREIWKMESWLRNYRRQARRLLAASGPQAELESKQLLEKLQRLGLISGEATLDDVLGLTIEDVLSRRLQTLVYKRGLARSPDQARQFISHGHIAIGERRITVPSYLVPVAEEGSIGYAEGAPVKVEPKPPEAVAEAAAEPESKPKEEQV